MEWVKEPPRPEVKTIKTKPPLKMQARKPDENLALRSKEKLLESSRHKLTEVARRSQRIVRENFDVTDSTAHREAAGRNDGCGLAGI